MIKFEKTEVFGWEVAIRGMRNPMNSWDKSQGDYRTVLCARCDTTYWDACVKCEVKKLTERDGYIIGPNDLDLMKRLIKAGSDHSKFMRMINVTVDITAPLYWWKEFDTYKVGTVANSCSTMHKIQAKAFTLNDFSHEHLIYDDDDISYDLMSPLTLLYSTIGMLNMAREKYLETKDKKYWWQMIQLLPSSYNQKRTVQLNYAVLRNIYFARKNHKLDEWSIKFINWIEDLPYSELITMEKNKDI